MFFVWIIVGKYTLADHIYPQASCYAIYSIYANFEDSLRFNSLVHNHIYQILI